MNGIFISKSFLNTAVMTFTEMFSTRNYVMLINIPNSL